MLEYALEFFKESLTITGIYLLGSIIALFAISNILYYTNATDSINTLVNNSSTYSPYLDDYESETEDSEVMDIVEDEQPIYKIEEFLENTNNLVENYKNLENPTYSDILKNTFAKTTLKERLEGIIQANKPVLVDDIFYPTPCASTLELKIWKQLLNDIMTVEGEYIN